MTIQQTFLDILKQCNLPKIDIIKVSPEKGKLRIQTYDADRVLFVDATSHEEHPEITGEFGMANFKTLKGLLNLPNFQSDNATFKVGTRDIAGQTYPDRIEFKGGGNKATFRLVNHEVVPEQPSIVNIPWDITLVLAPSKIAEFSQMASLYSDVETLFTVRSDGSTLFADFGNDSASTHSGTMTLAEDVDGQIVEMSFPIQVFLALMKLTGDSNHSEIRLTSKGLMGVIAATNSATYNYYVKKSVV